MKKIKKILLVVLTIMFLNKVSAAPINTSFNDDAFYDCIIVKLNTDGFNSLHDRDSATHVATKEELESITVLKCNESEIKDVKGIELLPNLAELNLSDNSISTIDLAKNVKLTNLLLSNNNLSSINLNKNIALENLYLNGNKLTNLDLKTNTNLLVLNVNNNKLTKIDLSSNTKLMDLKANTNAFALMADKMFKNGSLNLASPIVFPTENENLTKWQATSWLTKDANVATVNQKGTVKAVKSGSVNIVSSVEGVYSVTYNIVVSEISSDVYNIDDINETIAVDTTSISTIINNIKVTNGEIMIYNNSNKYVTSGSISNGYKLKVMNDAKLLKTYTLSIVEKVANNDLESLSVKDYNIDFDKDKTNYTIIVENSVTKVEVVAKASESSAEIEITGNDELEVGSNSVLVTVTGTDDTAKTYTINVIRKAGEEETSNSTADIYLETLKIKNYDLSFDKKVTDYNLKIDYELNELEIEATASDNQATVEIVGNKDLKNGSKIEIKVTSLEGATRLYTINIIKKNDDLWKTIISVLELLALALLVALCIILIVKHNKKKKNNQTTEKTPKKVEKQKVVAEIKDKNETPQQKITAEVTTITDGEKSIEIEKTQVEDYTKSEAYLEKTIRFRRVCPHCGTVNVLTNETCYLCGKELDKI